MYIFILSLSLVHCSLLSVLISFFTELIDCGSGVIVTSKKAMKESIGARTVTSLVDRVDVNLIVWW